ncbi:PREDICTED: meckelin-like [Acropora digitifera]|uniref:meckelin-like n=1 Tax=Acropora digitifera TaxID=70779 RepID=UPI00077A10BF|nr:PREDICTED: meckelin-like [Acropora digitifera]
MDTGCYTVVIHETQPAYRCNSINSFVCLLGNKNLFHGFIGPSIHKVLVKMAAPLASPSRSVEKRLLAYNTLNRFLSAFIDHSLEDLNYLVRDKLLLERILNMELKDQPPSDKAIFYNDNGRSFNSVLLYGHEWTLMLFDLLIFAFVDSLAQDFVLAGVVTYLVAKILIIFRNKFGRKTSPLRH